MSTYTNETEAARTAETTAEQHESIHRTPSGLYVARSEQNVYELRETPKGLMWRYVAKMKPAPTYDQLRAFLVERYKRERLEGRGEDYADTIVRSRLKDLRERGTDLISRHESATGRAIRYDANLNIL